MNRDKFKNEMQELKQSIINNEIQYAYKNISQTEYLKAKSDFNSKLEKLEKKTRMLKFLGMM